MAPANHLRQDKAHRGEHWNEYQGDWTLGDEIDFAGDSSQFHFLINDSNGYYSASKSARQSIVALREAINKGERKITVYRSVPSFVKEKSLRDGDWVTPSLAYARENAAAHGWGRKYRIIKQEVDFDELWWDGNDINEWGYDSSSNMGYNNVPNNRKLLDTVTYDDNGRVIPLSKRFNKNRRDPRFSLARSPEEFEETQRRAASESGIVMPGLNEKEVEVVGVDWHGFSGTGEEAIKKTKAWAKKNLVGRTDLWGRDSAGRVFQFEVSNKNLKEYLSGKAISKSKSLGVHLSVLKSLPEVVPDCVECEIHADMASNGETRSDTVVNSNDKLVHRFYGAVEIGEELYRVKVSMHEKKNMLQGVHAYVFQVTEVEISKEMPTSTEAHEATSSLREGIRRKISLTKLLQNVEKSYDKGKKILDASREEDLRVASEGGETGRERPAQLQNHPGNEGRGHSQSHPEGETGRGPRFSLGASAPIADRTLDALAEMHARNGDDERVLNAALTAFGRRLRQLATLSGKSDGRALRGALGAQRDFDEARAQNVAKTARAMMAGGLIDKPGKSEVSRLLSAASKAVGRRHLDAIADRMTDIVIDNQVRNGRQFLEKLMKTKAAKVDSRGVAAAGRMDAQGQEMLGAFRKHLKSDAATLDEQLQKCDDDITSGVDSQMLLGAARKQGLLLAQRYQAEVTAREGNIEAINAQLQALLQGVHAYVFQL